MNRPLQRFRRQRGQILILVGLSLIIMVGMTGLALDSGRGYAVKAKLNAAVDAGSIAAARAIVKGASDSERVSNAQAAALRYFNLNYPADYFGAPRPTPSISAVRDSDRRWNVTVSAVATMPTTFARVLGKDLVDVNASGTTVRRTLDVMMVLDVSGSLGPPTSPATTFPRLKTGAINGFVRKFSTDDDRVGLVAFSSGVNLDAGPGGYFVPLQQPGRGFDRTNLEAKINALPLGGATAAAEGMWHGVDQLNTIPAAQQSDLRVVLFFSDGAPNVVNTTFVRSAGPPVTNLGLYSETTSGGAPNRLWNQHDLYAPLPETSITNIVSMNSPSPPPHSVALPSYNNQRTLVGPPYTNTRCNVNRAARNMVENIANSARAGAPPIYVYAIGLGAALDTLEITFCGYAVANERGSTIMNRLANSTTSDTRNPAQPTGVYCHAATDAQLESCFSTIASEVLRLAI